MTGLCGIVCSPLPLITSCHTLCTRKRQGLTCTLCLEHGTMGVLKLRLKLNIQVEGNELYHPGVSVAAVEMHGVRLN